MTTFNAKQLRSDLFGGLTAAIVALPLALAFGVSSGAGPLAGIYGAICVGFFAAIFGGTPSQVSGPTGPMTVVMTAIFTQFAATDPAAGPALAFTVVMMAGLFQILFGLLKLGKYITLVPFPVISGFMSGIGAIIIIIEMGAFLGHDSGSSVTGALSALPDQINQLNISALLLGAGSLALLYLTPGSVSSRIPPALIALIAGSMLAVLLPDSADLHLIGEIPTGLPTLVMPTWNLELLQQMFTSAIVLAALGSIDSLLTSLVADNLTQTQHKSDKELIGQGIGNLAAGVLGGLPGAGATMRTVVNIRAGGRTPVSGATHALVLLALVLGFGWLAESIPHAVLAGILLKVGLDIIDWPFLERLHQMPPVVIGLTLLVFGLTVFVDLITAVLVGMFLANLITVKRLSDLQIQGVRNLTREDLQPKLTSDLMERFEAHEDRFAAYKFVGPFSYAASKELLNRVRVESNHKTLLLDFSEVPLIDVSTALAFESFIRSNQANGRRVVILGSNASVKSVFEHLRLERTTTEQMLFDTPEEAFGLILSDQTSQPQTNAPQ